MVCWEEHFPHTAHFINWATTREDHFRLYQCMSASPQRKKKHPKKPNILPYCWWLWCHGPKHLLWSRLQSRLWWLYIKKMQNHLHQSCSGVLSFILTWNEPCPRSACPSPPKITTSEASIYKYGYNLDRWVILCFLREEQCDKYLAFRILNKNTMLTFPWLSDKGFKVICNCW